MATANATPLFLTTTERVYMGRPAAEAVAEEAEKLGAQRIFLLVSSSLLNNTDEIERIQQALGDRLAATHSGIPPHGPRAAVLAAAADARKVDADLIVTVGGGSVSDAGKIIGIALKHNFTEHDDMEPFHVYVDDDGTTVKPEFDGPDIRVICCPTTLSGGEFNPLSGATDEKIGHKQGYEHPLMAPIAIVLDPALTLHTPEWLWTSTGVRAVDHALEALGSLQSDHFCDGMADSALNLLVNGLPAVQADPRDLDARLRCQVGAWQSIIPIIGGVPMARATLLATFLAAPATYPTVIVPV